MYVLPKDKLYEAAYVHIIKFKDRFYLQKYKTMGQSRGKTAILFGG